MIQQGLSSHNSRARPRETGSLRLTTTRNLELSLGGSIATRPTRWPANGLPDENVLSWQACPAGDVEGVLITGVYGAGKSSVAEEIADALEARGARFGAVDLDWLMWFGVPGVEPENLRRVFVANLTAVVANYRNAGVIHFVFAGAVRDREEVAELEAAAGMPLRVVRLVVSREQVDAPSDERPDQRPGMAI